MIKSNKNKIMIVGLPRSGTTIISNYINSMDNAFCFIEPHWQYKRIKKSPFFKDRKLIKFWFLKYNEKENLPLDKSIKKILNRYDTVGFKETFRSNIYKKIAPDVVNEELLKNYKKSDYKIIPIIRNPLNVWNSHKYSDKKMKSWAGDINLLLKNYTNFLNFFEPMQPIIYEKFVTSPNKTLKGAIPNLTKSTLFISRKINMGDPQANNSKKIEFQKKEICYTENEKNLIMNSLAMEKYKIYKQKK